MIIDTEFNVGDTVFYLQGYTICTTTISSISVEWSYADDKFVMVYKLADGSTSLRNDYPKWNRPLFQSQEALFNHLLKENNLHTWLMNVNYGGGNSKFVSLYQV